MNEIKWIKCMGMKNHEVSTTGEVRNTKTGKIRAQSFDKNAYKRVVLCEESKLYYFQTHRLVLGSFIGPSDKEVNHKNLKKDDNRLSNLEYVSHQENIDHAKANGAKIGKPTQYQVYCKTLNKHFISIKAATRYLISNEYTKAQETTIRASFTKLIMGVQKTLYGLEWGFINEERNS